MDVVATLAEIDPVFQEVAATLYPDFDPRELATLAKAMPDTSAVHATNSEQQATGRKKKLAAGLLAGAAIEGLAVHHTAKPLLRDIRAARKTGMTLKAVKPFVPHGPKLDDWGSGTHAALQAGNFAVGVGAARELVRKPKQGALDKAAPPESTMTAFRQIIDARRRGEIDTATALQLIDRVTPTEVSKGAGRFLAERTPVSGRFQRIADQAGVLRQAKLDHHSRTDGYANRRIIARGRAQWAGAGFAASAGASYHHRNKKLKQDAVPQFAKSADGPELEWAGEISKVDDDRRQVFGWCSLSKVDGQDVVDLQDDYVPIEEMEKAAYKYVIHSRKGGDMHKRVSKFDIDEPLHTADLIESVIVTPEKLRAMGVPDEAIAKVHTGWWIGFQVNDPQQWQLVKSQERTGFSIHGTGTRTPVAA